MASSPISRRIVVIGGDIDRGLVGKVISGEFEVVNYEPVLVGGSYNSVLIDGSRARAVFVREGVTAHGAWFSTASSRGIPVYRFNDTNVYRWQRKER